MKQKKGMGALGWILVILILIAIGAGIYFWLTGDAVGGIGSVEIPQPPALPS